MTMTYTVSREYLLKEIIPETSRVQYDDLDGMRLFTLGNQVTNASVMLIEALGAYRDVITAEINEDSAEETKKARYDLIRAWGLAQASLSKIAFVNRFDGDEAYRRTLDCPEDEDPELNDL
jgi:hypothetical protein